MDKEEPNFNTWGEISDSELVLEAAKREQNTKNNKEKRCFAQLEEDYVAGKPEANQLAIYKRARGFERLTIENKSS